MKLEFQINGEVPADFAEQVEGVLKDWQEGRYLFAVEMLQRALQDILKIAIKRSLRDKYFNTYGNECVQMQPGWQTARWVIEATKEFEELERKGLPQISGPPRVS